MPKFTITFKDPDGVWDSIDEAAESMIESTDEDEREELVEIKKNKIKEFISRWIKYQEYVRIEFDTDNGTATVLRN